jgi:hypothetical protein
MRAGNRELWLAFIAVLAVTAAYLFMVIMLDGIPPASDFYGHSIGILGFVLMLMTETLYSLRKRSRSARWGRMADWLNFHIFTGIVGPYMVLLHSSWKFNGLAGLTMLLTVIIVLSGFIGRYIYTAVPRSADGVELETGQLERLIAATQAELQGWLAANPQAAAALQNLQMVGAGAGSAGPAALVLERPWLDWQQRWRWRAARRRLSRQGPEGAGARLQLDQLERLVRRQEVLRRQVASLAMARRMLALWHAIHIPIGMALFTAAFIHVVAAIYYATLLR